MALANYTDLIASVASWRNRTDLTAQMPDFVALAESRIARDLKLRKQNTAGTISTSASTRAAALPADWISFESLNVDGSSDSLLRFVSMEYLDLQFPENGFSGKPVVYSIEGDNVMFGPMPDDVYTINVNYLARFPALQANSTNWLMTNHPNVYLYACLLEASLFIMDDEGAKKWGALYTGAVEATQKFDDQSTHSGSAMRVRFA